MTKTMSNFQNSRYQSVSFQFIRDFRIYVGDVDKNVTSKYNFAVSQGFRD